MGSFIQRSFGSGMNQQVDATRISPAEYPLLICGRSRYDTVEPADLPVADPSVPPGNMQGVFGAGQYGIVFVDGHAYYRDYGNVNSAYIRVDGFQMSAVASQLWAALIPASTFNFGRIAKDNETATVKLGTLLSPTPQGLVVQDGVSQPWLIDSNAQARVTQGYNGWSLNNPEYVPIGRQMLFANGILYTIWAKDRTTILRSVSGRPLNYMVNIKSPSGDKPAATEADGGAQTVSHTAGFGEVTCLANMNSPDGGFYVGTVGRSTKVVPDFTNTIFGEPQFDNVDLFPTGPLNQNCFTDIIGDNVFVDFGGIRSFNAVQQFRTEGKNSPFSAKVQRLFRKITQVQPCVGKFDNYALFSVRTVYGPGVLLYDEVSQTYVGLDIFPGVGAIKQFAEIKTNAVRKILFIDDGKLYEAYSGKTSKCQLYAGEWCSQDPKVAQTATMAKIVLTDVVGSGTVTVTPFIDGRREKARSEPVKGSGIVEANPQMVPFDGTREDVSMLAFDIGRVQSGWKVGLLVEFDFQCSLSHISLESKDETQTVAPGQAAMNLARLRK